MDKNTGLLSKNQKKSWFDRECKENSKVYYTFLLQQSNSLTPMKSNSKNFGLDYPTSNDEIEKWHSSGWGMLGKDVLDIADDTLYFKGNRENATSWITPYFSPNLKEANKKNERNGESYPLFRPEHIMIYDKSEEMTDLSNEYNKRTKEYYTDQKDLNERDEDIDKGEAIKDIILKIVVAEALNLSMKVLHKLVENYKYLTPVEVAAQKIEGKIASNIAYKIGKEAYRAYCIWRTTMDTAAKIRDSYRDMKEALQGMQETWGNVVSYYKELDWSSVKMTNISKVLPNRQINRFKNSTQSYENSQNRFMLAIDQMAFHSDTTLSGNYGVFNTFIDWTTAQLATGLNSTFEASDKIKDIVGVDYSFGYGGNVNSEWDSYSIVGDNTGRMQKLTNKDKNDPASAARATYLSNITALAQSAVAEVRLDVFNDEINALAIALSTIENDSKSWVQYYDYNVEMGKRIASNFNADGYYDNGKLKEGKKPFKDMIKSLNYPGGGRVFRPSATNAITNLQDWSKSEQKRIGDGRWDN